MVHMHRCPHLLILKIYAVFVKEMLGLFLLDFEVLPQHGSHLENGWGGGGGVSEHS